MNEQPLPDAIKRALMQGDLSGLTAEQQLMLYYRTCESLGLNPLTNPFQYLEQKIKGKTILKLYPTKGCSDQLRQIHRISEDIMNIEIKDGICIVKTRSSNDSGRHDEDLGAVAVIKEGGEWKSGRDGKNYFQGNGTWVPLQGEELANAMKRAVTQAKRRSTLAFCGLGMPDETEIDAIPDAVRQDLPFEHETSLASTERPALMPSEKPLGGSEPNKKPGPKPTSEEITQPKPTPEEITQLMELLNGAYKDKAIVEQHLRLVLEIPDGQATSPADFSKRVKLSMSRERYTRLEDDALNYRLAQAIDEDDVGLPAGPDAPTLPQEHTSVEGERTDSLNGQGSTTEATSAGTTDDQTDVDTMRPSQWNYGRSRF